MDIRDFSARLSAARNDFRKEVGKLRAVHKQRLDDKNRVFREKQDKRSKSYLKSVDDISHAASANANRYKVESQQAIAKNKDILLDKLKEQRDIADRELITYRNKYNRTLEDLKDDFHSNNEERERMSKERQDSLQRSLDNRFDYRTMELERDIKNLNKRAHDGLIDANKNSLKEHREHVEENRKALAELEKANRLERAEDKNKYHSNLEALRFNHRKRLGKMEDLQKNLKDRFFEERKRESNDKANAVQQFADTVLEKDKQSKEKRRIINKRDNIEQEQRIRKIEDLYKRRDIDPFRYRSEFVDKHRFNTLKNRTEDRAKRLMNHLLDNDLEHNKKRYDLIDQFKRDRRDQRVKFSDTYDRLRKDAFENFSKTLLDKRNHVRDIVKTYRNQMSDERATNENRLKASNDLARHRLGRERKEGLERMNSFVQKSKDSFTKIKTQNELDRKELLDDASRRLYLDTMDLKFDFNEHLGRTEASYEDKLHNLQIQFRKMKDYFQRKLDIQNDKFVRELNYKQKIFETQREDEKRAYREALANQSENNLKRFIELKNSFDNQLNKIRRENDMKLDDVVNNYEDNIYDIRKDNLIKKRREQKYFNDTIENLSEHGDKTAEGQRIAYKTKLEKVRAAEEKAKEELVKELTRIYDIRSNE